MVELKKEGKFAPLFCIPLSKRGRFMYSFLRLCVFGADREEWRLCVNWEPNRKMGK